MARASMCVCVQKARPHVRLLRSLRNTVATLARAHTTPPGRARRRDLDTDPHTQAHTNWHIDICMCVCGGAHDSCAKSRGSQVEAAWCTR